MIPTPNTSIQPLTNATRAGIRAGGGGDVRARCRKRADDGRSRRQSGGRDRVVRGKDPCAILLRAGRQKKQSSVAGCRKYSRLESETLPRPHRRAAIGERRVLERRVRRDVRLQPTPPSRLDALFCLFLSISLSLSLSEREPISSARSRNASDGRQPPVNSRDRAEERRERQRARVRAAREGGGASSHERAEDAQERRTLAPQVRRRRDLRALQQGARTATTRRECRDTDRARTTRAQASCASAKN